MVGGTAVAHVHCSRERLDVRPHGRRGALVLACLLDPRGRHVCRASRSRTIPPYTLVGSRGAAVVAASKRPPVSAPSLGMSFMTNDHPIRAGGNSNGCRAVG